MISNFLLTVYLLGAFFTADAFLSAIYDLREDSSDADYHPWLVNFVFWLCTVLWPVYWIARCFHKGEGK